MTCSKDTRFDGLYPDERLLSWHIPVRCRSGFDGQLPLSESIVPNSDAVSAVTKALLTSRCHVVALVGSAGTGKTTVLGWLLHALEMASMDVSCKAIRCSSRTVEELHEFLSQVPTLDHTQWLIIDGVDELRGEQPTSIDELLSPVIPNLLNGTTRVVLSVRPDIGRPLLVPPSRSLSNTIEWDDAWAGVKTAGGLSIAILQLQDLRHRDIEMYASRRGLGSDFVAHLRGLYDLRELVRRFFLLVKLCDLSGELDSEVWRRIRDRNELYERLLTTWLSAERERDPTKLPLREDDLLSVLERVALHIDRWILPASTSLTVQLGDTLQGIGGPELQGADARIVADALVNANILNETGFAHKSMEEYLIARLLARLVRNGALEPLVPSRVTDDVIGFLLENEDLRTWLDQNQDQLPGIRAEYLPHIIRLLHRQGRAIPSMDLHGAKLANLQLPGIRLRNAILCNADLEGTQLGAADLTGADLRGAVLENTSVWTTGGATEMYSSSEGPDRVWLIRPSAKRATGEAVLVACNSDSASGQLDSFCRVTI